MDGGEDTPKKKKGPVPGVSVCVCKFCGGTFKWNAHSFWCEKNPDRDANRERLRALGAATGGYASTADAAGARHARQALGTPEARKRNSEMVKRLHAEGVYLNKRKPTYTPEGWRRRVANSIEGQRRRRAREGRRPTSDLLAKALEREGLPSPGMFGPTDDLPPLQTPSGSPLQGFRSSSPPSDGGPRPVKELWFPVSDDD